MNNYIALYRIESIMTPLEEPFGFSCMADNGDHAEEQCLNAYPDCEVVWVSLTENYQEALDDYYGAGES